MNKIPESFLHFLWKYNLFNKESLKCDQGRIEIIERGEYNTGSGPDFFNARIRINETIWAGNVEIHTKASDWFRHGHQDDPAYSNVILHVVTEIDCMLERPGGEVIPTIILDFDTEIFKKYSELIKNREKIPCGPFLSNVSGLHITDWIGKLLIERLEEKTSQVLEVLKENKYNWEETLYRFLGKGFGFKINAYPFETLVRTIPLLTLLKYRNQPLTINAIIFGQAGFLEDIVSEDVYYNSLQKEYKSLKTSLPSRVLGQHTWKFMGSRPANFPIVRISQFASLITKNFPLFSLLLENFKLNEWQKVLASGTDFYWEDHYLLRKTGRLRNIKMGAEGINMIILNSFIPVYFQYAIVRKRNDLKDHIISMLEQLPAESNSILKKWAKNKIIAKNSFDSQALIHLTTRYCYKRRCLECLIGINIMGKDGLCKKKLKTKTNY